MRKNQKGFSIVELLVVLALIMILTTITVFYLSGHQKLYKTDDQSLLIADMLQEARQRSLTQRETIRVEIDITENIVRLIDENTPLTSDDDEVIKQQLLYLPNEVRLDRRPDEISVNPPEESPVPNIRYIPSVYPTSAAHQVATLRFHTNGTVSDAGTNPIGSGALISGITLHIWTPNVANTNESTIARALTVIGSTGTIRFWEYDRGSTETNKWRDARRISGYSGQSAAGNP